jgi:hypothetical protein
LNNTLPFSTDVQRRFEEIQMDRLIVSLSSLIEMGSRHALSTLRDPTRNIYGARQALIAEFNAIKNKNPTANIDVWTQPVTAVVNGYKATTDNVVAVFPGTDIDAGVIVIGAHYDTLNTTEFFDTRMRAPGANNNASGVAVMLEAARILAAQPHRATIIFIALTASETGRQGSETFIKGYLDTQKPPIIPRAMIDLDTLGANRKANGADGPNAIRVFSADPNESSSRQLARTLKLIASAYPNLPVLDIQAAEERFGRFSDHQTFSAHNIAAVHWVEAWEDPNRQRTIYDTLESLNPDYMVTVTKTVIAAISGLAGGLNAPGQFALRREDDIPILEWRAVPGASAYVVALRSTSALNFEQVFVTGSAPTLGWAGLSRYSVAAVGTVDSNGVIGQLSPEFKLADLQAAP